MKFEYLSVALITSLPAASSGQKVYAPNLRSANAKPERRLGRGDSEPKGNGPCDGLCNAYDKSGCRDSDPSKGCIRLEDALSDWGCSCTFTTIITAAGNPSPIEGPTGFGTNTLCDPLLTSGDAEGWWDCLSSPEAGPVVVGNWWFNQDAANGAFVFEEGSVCGVIDGTELDSRTRFQLWEHKYKNMRLDIFTEFKVGYDVVSPSTSSNSNQGYLNIYMRTGETSTAYYDCRFDFLVPTDEDSGTLLVDQDKQKGNSASHSSGDSNGCAESTTIKEYLAANSNAVLGVGNVEVYAFVLNTGSTNESNVDLKTCWSDITITTTDGGDETYVDIYEFTTLPSGVFN
ncbi:hypothetical protein QTG54_005861 [Skeletonema marinoi]|uniref:Uncharacterized protein n=1 Tax=Skeletonema marinoi TaxID=267567 RepID=A0AAD8YDX7_9STRA|nr:hypothetical protein QTG54_005861 [Skeletonema marinoi]